MHYAVSYVSTAQRDMEPSEVVELLDQTEVRNNKLGISGLLIYSEGNFFEVLEGGKELILELYDVIRQDDRHKNIIQIFEKSINGKPFNPENGYFISANTQYKKLNIDNFQQCIQDLDEGTQKVVNNMLIQIGKNSPSE